MAVQEIKISENESIWVEYEDVDIKAPLKKGEQDIDDMPEGAEPVGFAEDFADAVQLIKSNIASMASLVHESLKDNQPEEWGVELNIGFKGRANIIPVILSGETTGGIKVTAKWTKS